MQPRFISHSCKVLQRSAWFPVRLPAMCWLNIFQAASVLQPLHISVPPCLLQQRRWMLGNYVLAPKGFNRQWHKSLLLVFHWGKQIARGCINSRWQKRPRGRGKPGTWVSVSSTMCTMLVKNKREVRVSSHCWELALPKYNFNFYWGYFYFLFRLGLKNSFHILKEAQIDAPGRWRV